MSRTNEVSFSENHNFSINGEMVRQFVNTARQNSRKRFRLCAHSNEKEVLQEMFIVHTRDTYVRPHKHVGKIESFLLISGKLTIVIFDNSGKVMNVIDMGEYASGKSFYYRIADEQYHTMIIKSEIVVFKEATLGPFDRKKTIFAPWAPDGEDSLEVECYMDGLVRRIDVVRSA